VWRTKNVAEIATRRIASARSQDELIDRVTVVVDIANDWLCGRQCSGTERRMLGPVVVSPLAHSSRSGLLPRSEVLHPWPSSLLALTALV